jgi:hypothetical protein
MRTFVIEVNPVSGDHAGKTLTAATETSATHLAETGRQLWRELFLEIETEEQLTDWELRIPSYGCDCQAFYLDWKLTNPPTFPLLPRWKYDLKSAVNEKLKHPNITFEEACGIWGWQETQ